MDFIVTCYNVEAVNGVIEYREINILEDVLFMDVTPKPPSNKKKTEPPAGIPRFYTRFGIFLQCHSIEKYEEALQGYGFDYFMPYLLVNTRNVDYIKMSDCGNAAYFKGVSHLNIPVSRYKTKEYDYLIVKD